MSKDDYASAYFGGKTVFLEWLSKHTQSQQREQAENTVREFLSAFRNRFPEEYENMLKSNPDVRKVDRMFGMNKEV